MDDPLRKETKSKSGVQATCTSYIILFSMNRLVLDLDFDTFECLVFTFESILTVSRIAM